MDEKIDEILDLSKRGLKKIEKAPTENSKTITSLILDQNELQKLDNIDTYNRIENLSICNNFLLRMHGVSRLTNIRELALNNNGILQIEGLKDLIYLKVLKLAGNNIKSIEHLSNNMHLEHLDLSNNQISIIADISYLKCLKHLNLERNRVIDLRQCDRYLPTSIIFLALSHNHIQDLNEVCHLVNLNALDSFSIQGNPCVAMAGKDKLGFDYRPFILNWILSVKTIDGFVVSAIESLKAEWLYSQGKGRHYHTGQHDELCKYLASTCPLTADALDTEDQRKLRLILSKAQHHQQQLKDTTNSPVKSKLQSPRMQSRIASRHVGRSPDRLSSSYHSALSKSNSPCLMTSSCISDVSSNGIPQAMSQSFDSPGLMYAISGKTSEAKDKISLETPNKLINQPLEAASKMVPVPESLMSPDYHDPTFEIQRKSAIHSPSVNSIKDQDSTDKSERSRLNKSVRSSPKLSRSPMSSPKFKTKAEQRKNSTKSTDSERTNGVKDTSSDRSSSDSQPIKTDGGKVSTNQRRPRKLSVESMAATTIQKMWRGYRSRNLNKDSLRILHAIQAARSRQHIQRLSCDMEATKAALESERKIQQLQMQAINALWKKVSTIQNSTDTNKQKTSEDCNNVDTLRQLADTCINLQTQVVELQDCMQQVLRAVTGTKLANQVATQTDISAVDTPQEDRSTWLRRPQSLALSNPPPLTTPIVTKLIEHEPTSEVTNQSESESLDCIESMIEDKVEIETQPESQTESKSLTESKSQTDKVNIDKAFDDMITE